METRRKLQRSYNEGETARADKFLERLRCLRCGGLDHFLVSCPELAFLSKDDRWDVAALYKAGQVSPPDTRQQREEGYRQKSDTAICQLYWHSPVELSHATWTW